MIGPVSAFPRIQPIVKRDHYSHLSESTRLNPWGWYPGFGYYKHRDPESLAIPRKKKIGSDTTVTAAFMEPWVAYGIGFGQGQKESPWDLGGDHPIEGYTACILNSDWVSLEDIAYLGYLTYLTPHLNDGTLLPEQKKNLVDSVSRIAIRFADHGAQYRDQLQRHVAGLAKTEDVGGHTNYRDGATHYINCLIADYVGPGVTNTGYTCGVKRVGSLAHRLSPGSRSDFHSEMLAVFEEFAQSGPRSN